MAKANTFKRWTDEDVTFLKENYELLTRKEIADHLNRTFGSVKSKAKELDIKKSNAALSKIAQRPNNGQFKPNEKPLNYKPIGYIRKHTDKRTGRTYLWVKTNDDHTGELSSYNFEMLHQVNWIKENGPIPEGMILHFKDGNSLNCDPENLKLISMAENMYRNSIHEYPEEIIPAMVLVNKINKKLNSLENGEK